MSLSRFRRPKTVEEEELAIENAVPKSTRYKNRWANGLFEEWQRERERSVKEAVVDQGLFKNYNIEKVQSLNTPLLHMDATSLNYWLTKFVQEVAKRSQERYPPRTVYKIIAGIRRFIEEKRPDANFSLLMQATTGNSR